MCIGTHHEGNRDFHYCYTCQLRFSNSSASRSNRQSLPHGRVTSLDVIGGCVSLLLPSPSMMLCSLFKCFRLAVIGLVPTAALFVFRLHCDCNHWDFAAQCRILQTPSRLQIPCAAVDSMCIPSAMLLHVQMQLALPSSIYKNFGQSSASMLHKLRCRPPCVSPTQSDSDHALKSTWLSL